MNFLQKYKICPSCDEKNDTGLLECLVCETDLTRVKITDDESELAKEEENRIEKELPSSKQEKVYRICDCGKNNPPNGRKCAACGEDISDIIPSCTIEPEKNDNIHCILTSIDGLYTYELKETVTIGREGTISEYLNQKSYVSRVHARLYCEIEGVFIENLSNTNFTYVNQEKITIKTLLQTGDLIGLGGTYVDGNYQEQAAYFQVRFS